MVWRRWTSEGVFSFNQSFEILRHVSVSDKLAQCWSLFSETQKVAIQEIFHDHTPQELSEAFHVASALFKVASTNMG